MTPLTFDYPISVAILYYGGTAADLIDTLECVKGLKEALESRGHRVRTLEVTAKNWRRAVNLPGEVVFNLVEDPGWELYIKVGTRLENIGRAQMGHDIKLFKYVAKKSRVKRKMAANNISTPYFRIFSRRWDVAEIRSLEYPLIVKPSGEHAGIGISQDSVVIDNQELVERAKYLFKNFPGEVIAEEFIEGREIHVTVIGNGRHVGVLPYCEIIFGGEFADNWDVYTYDAKWEKKSWEYWDARVLCPIRMNKRLEARIDRLVKRAYRVLGCRDIARFDMRVDDTERAYIVDVNISPSLNRYDDQDATTAAVKALGWSYEEFIETLVAVTYKRVYGQMPARIRERSLLLQMPRKIS